MILKSQNDDVHAAVLLRVIAACVYSAFNPNTSLCIITVKISSCSTMLVSIRHALPALPVCMISPVGRSSLLSTGHAEPSAFANVNSSFVPMILNSDFFVSIGAYSGIEAAYRLLSEVKRSRSKVVGEEKMTLDFALSIFLR